MAEIIRLKISTDNLHVTDVYFVITRGQCNWERSWMLLGLITWTQRATKTKIFGVFIAILLSPSPRDCSDVPSKRPSFCLTNYFPLETPMAYNVHQKMNKSVFCAYIDRE